MTGPLFSFVSIFGLISVGAGTQFVGPVFSVIPGSLIFKNNMATTAFSRAGQLLRGTILTHRLVSLSSTRTKATLPDLPYDYNALEPIISAEIMQLHHSKHHAAYVNNLNIAKEKLATAKDLDETTLAGLKSAIHFNGGGHINHSLFWQMLSPKGGSPGEDFLHAITSSFGSFEQMKSTVSAKAIAVQGSGWGWLAMCPKTGDLSAVTCANQDPLFETTGLVPLFGIDVWEHAYYLQYKNVRADYVNAIWQVANWADIEARYNTVVEQIPPPSFPEDN